MNVTPTKRTKIVTLSKHMRKTQTAKLVGVNQGAVSRIVKKVAETGRRVAVGENENDTKT